MPQITSYTPAWLSKPNPGHDIFTGALTKAGNTHTTPSNAPDRKRAAKPGPRRTIARRGTEVFVAVGREIRWADLVYLKEAWEDGQKKKSSKGKDIESRNSQYSEDHAQGYRVSFDNS